MRSMGRARTLGTSSSGRCGLWVLRLWANYSRPALELVLAVRRAVGKETDRSLGERRFETSRPRPASWRGGKVVWFHAASLGECISVIPLVRAVLDQSSDRRALVTTSTTTARDWIDDALSHQRLSGIAPERVAVRLVPCDARPAVERFLSAWAPDCGVFVESELWPALLHTCSTHGVPLALVSARLSARSFSLWSRPGLSAVAGALLSYFELVIPQCAEQSQRFARLGVRVAPGCVANLKWCDPGQAAPPAKLQAAFAQSVVQGRAAWVALSTHDGEDVLLARAHEQLVSRAAQSSARPLLIVIPRHGNDSSRVERAAGAYRERGLTVTLQSELELAELSAGSPDRAPATPSDSRPSDVYVCDAIGQVQLLLRACKLVVVCGSLVEGVGGHNPLEPMRAGCAVIIGPHAPNVASTLAAVDAHSPKARAVEQLPCVDDLARALRLLEPARADELRRRGQAALGATRALEADVLARTLSELQAILPPPPS
ncbi:3-deoxy-D-manno-octulosonic-acid transferase-domain-containing protein [Pavlovales sp. CCMP2436]|nr:3-deoxy-D-manno-octulosonic-acid transferase-domain-containing protein [Pavlovales sp. CCMP2436]